MISGLFVFFPCVFFCLLNVWLVYFSKRAFGICIPVTLMGSTLILYFSQIVFQTFRYGYYTLLVAAGASICLLVIKRKDITFTTNFFSWGFFSFLAICILFMIINFDRHFWFWDELSHWGKMVKEMIRTDKFYSDVTAELLVHKEYPPFASVFELLWCKLSGGYSEMAVTMSLNIFSFTLLLTNLVDTLNLKNTKWYSQLFIGGVLTGIFLITILFFDVSCTSLTICPDLFMSVLYVYLISLIMNRKEIKTVYGYFCFLMGMFCLMIVKQMSIAFVLLAWFFYTIMEFADGSDAGKQSGKRLFLKSIASAITIIVPLFSNRIWGHYTKSIEVSGQFFLGKISTRSLLDIFSGKGTDIQNQTFKNFFRALLLQTQSAGLLRMSYIFAMVTAVLLLCFFYVRSRDKFPKKHFNSVFCLFLLGTVGYAFTMLVLYMFCYSEDEMAILAGYDRYMSAYVISEYILLLILAIHLFIRKDEMKLDIRRLILYAILILILFDYKKLAYVIPQTLRGEPYAEYRVRAQNIESQTADASTIFLISSENTKDMFFLDYYLENRRMDSRYLFTDLSNENTDDSEFWNQVVACLKEDDFLYVFDATDISNEIIGKYTSLGVLEDSTTYRIETVDNMLELIKIE